MERIQLFEIKPDEFIAELTRTIITAIKEYDKTKVEEKFLSPADVCKLLHITKPTVTKWTDEKKLKMYRIGGRIFYKYSEIMIALEKIKKYKR